jgi:hypothetical protein
MKRLPDNGKRFSSGFKNGFQTMKDSSWEQNQFPDDEERFHSGRKNDFQTMKKDIILGAKAVSR